MERNEEKKIYFQVILDEKLNNSFESDSLRIYQILNNLCSNAIKFTHKGGVKLSIKVNGDNENNQRIKFEIIDTGIGINTVSPSIWTKHKVAVQNATDAVKVPLRSTLAQQAQVEQD